MPQYAGNLVTATIAGSTQTVATNYRRLFAPFSNFGTRELAFFKVTLGASGSQTALNTNTTDAGVLTADVSNIGGTGDQYAILDSSGNVVVPPTYVYASNSNIYAAVNGIQIAGELAFMGAIGTSGTPGTSQVITFVVGLFIDTAASKSAGMQVTGAGANAAAQTIATAVQTATGFGSSDVQVVPAYIVGGSLLANSGIMTSTGY
jgi:hypothetical protein